MKDLTLISCSYNTPDVTMLMLKSFALVHDAPQHVLISENSTNEDTTLLLNKYNIPYIRNQGFTHGDGINELLEQCNTKYALLVDTDVIFLKNHLDVFKQFKEMELALMGKIEGDRGGKRIYKRVNPWHCFINVDLIKHHNIKFFDQELMKNSFNTDCIYDIGSTFFKSVKENKLRIGDVDYSNEYFLHLEGMSWYKNKFDPSKEDTGIDFGGTHNNFGFVQAYEQKYAYFNHIKSRFECNNLTGKFIK